MPATWKAWTAFLAQPRLPDRATLDFVGGVRALAPLLALDLMIMALLIGSLGAAVALGFEMPDHMLGDMKPTAGMIALIVLAAPLGEEIMFRGWLSGRPGHVAAILALAAGGAIAALGDGAMLSAAGAIGGVLLAPILLFVLRKRPAMGWFQRHFRWFYWGSVLAFAAVHLGNFADASPTLLPLVLPQFVLATFLGYLRVNYGLWSSVLMHMLHNSVFAALMVAGAS